MPRTLIEKLLELGLTDKESAVYIALIQAGEMTAEQAATLTKLNRSTTYVQLKQLIERGLVSTFKRGKKTFFAAESPSNLLRIVEQRREVVAQQELELKVIVTDLLKVYGKVVERPSVRVFEGKEGLVSMRSAILDQKTPEMRAVTSVDHMRRIFSKEELMQFTERREKNGTKSMVIYSLEKGDDFTPLKLQTFKRVSKKDLPFSCDVYIYGDFVSFASTDNQIVGVTIASAAIASTIKALFETAWRS
ncbi:ArsR family transcriptional regulator [Patescibacteria group bacterium]|nr:ArsR family transcriptional regulator [Patescibacteria group bacterium]